MTGILFILFMSVVMGGAFLFDSTMTGIQDKQKTELESCIMEQIELAEENRDNYFPRMRDEILHTFIMKCVDDKSFRSRTVQTRKTKQ